MQISGRILLCHIHVMKAWSEDLLTKISICDKNSVWRALYVLLFYPDEDHFDRDLRKICEEFSYIHAFATYINTI